jgi:hypothetical protein
MRPTRAGWPAAEAVASGQILPPAAPIAGDIRRQNYKKSIVYGVFAVARRLLTNRP